MTKKIITALLIIAMQNTAIMLACLYVAVTTTSEIDRVFATNIVLFTCTVSAVLVLLIIGMCFYELNSHFRCTEIRKETK